MSVFANDVSVQKDRPLALTMGDPSGIGLDLTLAAFAERQTLDLPPFMFLGDPNALEERAQLLGHEIEMQDITEQHTAPQDVTPQDVMRVFQDRLPIYPIKCPNPVKAGAPDSGNAQAILQSIQTAVHMTRDGQVSAIVTNPIAKSVLYEAGFSHPGHTEYLAELSRIADQPPPLPVMMLAGPHLKTIPVTIHIPLMDITSYLTTELIVQTAMIAAKDLTKRFGILKPRLAVSGLNPHAGENGALGKEDDAIIRPAISKLQRFGIDAKGPHPADTMFHDEARQTYDVAICMYHDQALIPAKALGFHDAANVTLGLPFIRTSPDHGTAFGIAGQNIARHESLVSAMKMAANMVKYQESSET